MTEVGVTWCQCGDPRRWRLCRRTTSRAKRHLVRNHNHRRRQDVRWDDELPRTSSCPTVSPGSTINTSTAQQRTQPGLICDVATGDVSCIQLWNHVSMMQQFTWLTSNSWTCTFYKLCTIFSIIKIQLWHQLVTLPCCVANRKNFSPLKCRKLFQYHCYWT